MRYPVGRDSPLSPQTFEQRGPEPRCVSGSVFGRPGTEPLARRPSPYVSFRPCRDPLNVAEQIAERVDLTGWRTGLREL